MREIALQVSDPSSSTYGRYMSADEIHELTELRPSHVTALGDGLCAAGVSWTRRGDVVDAQLTVEVACELLRTVFSWVVHSATGQTPMRATAVFLPRKVHDSWSAVYSNQRFLTQQRSQNVVECCLLVFLRCSRRMLFSLWFDLLQVDHTLDTREKPVGTKGALARHTLDTHMFVGILKK